MRGNYATTPSLVAWLSRTQGWEVFVAGISLDCAVCSSRIRLGMVALGKLLGAILIGLDSLYYDGDAD